MIPIHPMGRHAALATACLCALAPAACSNGAAPPNVIIIDTESSEDAIADLASDATVTAGDTAAEALGDTLVAPDALTPDTLTDPTGGMGQWLQIAVPGDPNVALHGVWAASPTSVLVAGSGGTLLHYDGLDWKVDTAGVFPSLNALHGQAKTNAWAVGLGGTRLRWNGAKWGPPGGCTAAPDCDDADPCTLDSCESGTCAHAASNAPGCCGGKLYGADFDNGLAGWLVVDTAKQKGAGGGIVWNVASVTSQDGKARNTSPPNALYFGQPGVPCTPGGGNTCPNFDNGQVVAATATSPAIQVPSGAGASLTFQLFMDTEGGTSYDKLEVNIVTATGGKKPVWTKAMLSGGGTTGGQFLQQTVDLTAFAGQLIALEFLFDSTDSAINGTEGVYIDDVIVTSLCGSGGATPPPGPQSDGVGTLFGVWGAASDDVWAVGVDGIITHWDGKVWKKATGGVPREVHGLGGAADGTLFAVGDKGLVATIKGAVYNPKDAPVAATLRAVAVDSATSAVAVGDGGTILELGGTGWQAVQGVTTDNLVAVATLGGGERYAVGKGGAILHRGASGKWTSDITVPGELHAVTAPSLARVVAVGADGMLCEKKGGIWEVQPGALQATYNGLFSFNNNDIWAVGNDGQAAHWDGAMWSATPTTTSKHLRAVWGASPDDLWAVGLAGAMVRWNGLKWSEVEPPGLIAFEAVWGVKTDAGFDLYVAAQKGLVLRWNGSDWSIVAGPITKTLRGVWGAAADDVWAVGDDALVAHFGGGGWTPVSIEPYMAGDPPKKTKVTASLYAIWGASKDDIWAAGEASGQGTAAFIHWDGKAWTYQPQKGDNTVRGLVGRGPDDILAVGTTGAASHFDGEAWIQLETNVIATLFGASTSGKDYWVSGDAGTLLRWIPPTSKPKQK